VLDTAVKDFVSSFWKVMVTVDVAETILDIPRLNKATELLEASSNFNNTLIVVCEAVEVAEAVSVLKRVVAVASAATTVEFATRLSDILSSFEMLVVLKLEAVTFFATCFTYETADVVVAVRVSNRTLSLSIVAVDVTKLDKDLKRVFAAVAVEELTTVIDLLTSFAKLEVAVDIEMTDLVIDLLRFEVAMDTTLKDLSKDFLNVATEIEKGASVL
jgi:hypothetical protein